MMFVFARVAEPEYPAMPSARFLQEMTLADLPAYRFRSSAPYPWIRASALLLSFPPRPGFTGIWQPDSTLARAFCPPAYRWNSFNR